MQKGNVYPSYDSPGSHLLPALSVRKRPAYMPSLPAVSLSDRFFRNLRWPSPFHRQTAEHNLHTPMLPHRLLPDNPCPPIQSLRWYADFSVPADRILQHPNKKSRFRGLNGRGIFSNHADTGWFHNYIRQYPVFQKHPSSSDRRDIVLPQTS